MSTPYEILGVPPDADAAAIKAAFRSMIQKNHPDKGGSAALAQQVQGAYDILSNPKKRVEYDTTGKVGVETSGTEKALVVLSEIMASLFEVTENAKKDIGRIDIVQVARNEMHSAVQSGTEGQCRLTRHILSRRKALKLLRRRSGDAEHLELVLLGQIVDAERKMESNERQIKLWRDVLTLLADYDYELEPAPAPVSVPVSKTLYVPWGG